MIAKTPEDFDTLRKAGKILGDALRELSGMVKTGANAADLDVYAERFIVREGGKPSFLRYKPEGAKTPYPAALCVSVNDEVVHGIPTESRVFEDGDVVTIDLGLSYNGYFVDAARTVIVGQGDDAAHKLLDGTREALQEAIKAAKVGGHVGDIGAAVVRVARKYDLGIVMDLGGHAVGRAVHEKPFIANDGKEGEGAKITDGLVLAIEPMLCESKGDIILAEDDWTYKMQDGGRAAHFEDTVIITKDGQEILTR